MWHRSPKFSEEEEKKRMKRKEEENEKKKAISVVLMLSREQKIWPQNITDLKTFSPKGKI